MVASTVTGSALRARSRPTVVRACCASNPRTASHSMPRPQIRPASISRLIRSRPSLGVPAPELGVLPPLIGHPLAPLRLLARCQRLPLPPHAGLLVMLALLELGQEPGLLALLLEALESAFE